MRCVILIWLSFTGVVLSRPQTQPHFDTTPKSQPQVESSNSGPSSRLLLPFPSHQDSGKTNFNPPTAIFQFHRFPKHFVQSNFKNEDEFRKLLINLALGEPRNVVADKLKSEKNQKAETIVADLRQAHDNKPPSLAPYRLHPLFHYIQNRNTIAEDKVIRFRTSNFIKEGDVTTLILKPQSTAVAGAEGKAVSNPLAKAILREGTNADILFEPAAVAIAGPGGIAHAQSDLEINYATNYSI